MSGRVRAALCVLLLALSAGAPQPPTVRRLNVLIVLYTRSFARTLTREQAERVHEEVAEFYDFYQSRGSGKVDFQFSLLQIDRPLRRDEVDEVAPGRYYLSRENVAPDLKVALDTTRTAVPRFDEVIALYAWNNANPEGAQLAYGGGAVGPDGRFFGDAGFNSIGLFAWDVERVGQILIHEVLHNVDDMFARSGMPDEFFNSDEMSRNMPQLLREKPGAFLPRFTDAEMLAYAERERTGKESYPWAMQLVYYGWMLERTPKRAWDALKYGAPVPPLGAGRPRWLYRTVYQSAARDSVYAVALASSSAVAVWGRRCVPLAPKRYTQVDFDGAPVYSGSFLAARVPIAASDDVPPLELRDRCGASATHDREYVVAAAGIWIDAPARIDLTTDDATPIRVRLAGDRSVAAIHGTLRATLRARVGGRDVPLAVGADSAEYLLDPRALPAGVSTVTISAADLVPVRPASIVIDRGPSWAISAERAAVGPMMGPVNLTVDVRERAPVRARVRATVRGRTVPMTEVRPGRYTVNLDSLPPGLHEVVVTAERDDGSVAVDTERVWSEPRGYLRVPDSLTGTAGTLARLGVRVRTREGAMSRGLALPLVAITAGRALPLAEDSSGEYSALVPVGAGQGRATVVSLLGSFPRRVVMLRGTGTAPAPTVSLFQRAGSMDLASAVRVPIRIDGAFDDWTLVPPMRLDSASLSLLTDRADYRGNDDLSALVRFAWDDSTFYLFARVDDDSVTAGEAWDVDRINLVFDANADDTPLTYGSPNPVTNEWQEDDYWVYLRPFGPGGEGTVHREGSRGSGRITSARVASVRHPRGYTVEASIPLRELPRLGGFVGSVAGFQLFVTDGDGRGAASELMWHGRWPFDGGGLSWRLADMGRLVFVDEP